MLRLYCAFRFRMFQSEWPRVVDAFSGGGGVRTTGRYSGTLRGLSGWYREANWCKHRNGKRQPSTRYVIAKTRGRQVLQRPSKSCNLRRKVNDTHFHGDNTGSNPVGDANTINNLDKSSAGQVKVK